MPLLKHLIEESEDKCAVAPAVYPVMRKAPPPTHHTTMEKFLCTPDYEFLYLVESSVLEKGRRCTV